jgi:hypothetical protein
MAVVESWAWPSQRCTRLRGRLPPRTGEIVGGEKFRFVTQLLVRDLNHEGYMRMLAMASFDASM